MLQNRRLLNPYSILIDWTHNYFNFTSSKDFLRLICFMSPYLNHPMQLFIRYEKECKCGPTWLEIAKNLTNRLQLYREQRLALRQETGERGEKRGELLPWGQSVKSATTTTTITAPTAFSLSVPWRGKVKWIRFYLGHPMSRTAKRLLEAFNFLKIHHGDVNTYGFP